MGKTYIDTVKYMVKASYEVDGQVEKPDIVGAIFGQTEGLIGDELDLREMQKNGRIGRIEVETQMRDGKSVGSILIPSSLDMVETSILAASLEVVDRVGPYDARIRVSKIEDSRNSKRKTVMERAKMLLKTLVLDEMPESKELTEMVRNELKVDEVQSFGDDKLPCGPGIFESEEIVVVEGRADVINLMKNNIKNVIAIGGANVNKTIIELCKKKETTVFLDGDRGGDIILKELLTATEIDFIARAPPGKEVEELARKEIIQSLRRRVPADQAEASSGGREGREPRGERGERFDRRDGRDQRGDRGERRDQRPERGERGERPGFQPREPRPEQGEPRGERMERREPVVAATPTADGLVSQAQILSQPGFEVPADQSEVLRASMKELEGTLHARIYSEAMEKTSEMPIRDLIKNVSEGTGVYAVVLDGIVTQRLLDLAEEKGVKAIAGIRAGNITRKPTAVHVILNE